MHLIERFWASVTVVVSFFTLSPVESPEQQGPLLDVHDASSGYPRGPIFRPPGAGPDSDFLCDYSNMPGPGKWTSCNTPENRSCWLKNDVTGQVFDINTNYEDINQTPLGIHRVYNLTIANTTYNADGIGFSEAKLFNGSYPGPWIQGCWGDKITVIVNNSLTTNGTGIHWHGIRQWKTMHMDGVGGVTQCPIAPGDTFNYTWRAMQYGSSWYHSHYSVQYADGAVGPLSLHGPSSANWDEPKKPLLMTDWGHNSAFEAIFLGLNGLTTPSILLNGTGNVTRYNNAIKNTEIIPDIYTLNFDPPKPGRVKRYLLRLINTSFDSTFVFSIDNHNLTVIESDFVPIRPYTNKSVLIGIGQRYHVIVEANPIPNEGIPPPTDGNFWIRTYKANCFGFNQNASPGYEQTGILRYDSSSKTVPKSTAWSTKTLVSLDCSDETYGDLHPILPWNVGPAANDILGHVGQNLSVQGFKKSPSIFPLAAFSIGLGSDFIPFQIDYADPMFLKLNFTGKWTPSWVVIPEDYTDKDWVYLILQGLLAGSPGAHPIHLHGHDFAILQQMGNATFPQGLNLTKNNPPRRDVVLLPNNGYVVIAFKADNPGSWLMHCHIANHASNGLGLQILERKEDAMNIWPSVANSTALRVANEGCHKWTKWWGDCNNWWSPTGKPGGGCELTVEDFAPDSGV